jgi:myo-inositol 2-dehydrogenase/D-chiro-inositol 1-dehydrogenase
MLRVAILGAGSKGHTHAVGWASTDAKVVGVNALAGAEEVAAICGASVYDDLDALLSQVDIVDICLPTHLHKEYTLKAAAAGKHIFCEKPIARTVEDGQQMIAACKAAGVRLFIGQVVRFFPQYQKAHDALQAGKLGNLAVLRLTRVSYRPRKALDDWFSDVNRSGGPLLDMLVHDYDYARWLGGEVERVYTRCSPPDAGGISEYAQVLLRFRSGAIAHIEGGWAYPPPLFRTKIEAAGDGGLLEWDSDSTVPLATYFKATPGEVADVGLPLSPLDVDPYTAIIQHFYGAIQHDKPFAVTAEDALAAVQIGIAALESGKSGLPVTLTPLPEVG